MSKTATRRAPGRSAEEIQAAVERFLKASQKPALLEPGEEMIPLAGGNFAMEARNSRLMLQAWDDRRNVVRRVVDIRESAPGRLELVSERFAGKRGALFLLDLARPASQSWERRGTRLVFRERFRQFLSREFPAWKIDELSTEADLEHTLSPAYPRALLKHGSSGLAAMAAAPNSPHSSGVLSFGLIWLDYLRQRERRITIEGLVLFLPAEQGKTTSLRVSFLDRRLARFEVFTYSGQDHTARIDLRDAGNLDSKLEVCRQPSGIHREALSRLLAIPGVEELETSDGEISLRVRGMEFARTAGETILFGFGDQATVRGDRVSEIEQLARQLASMRHPEANGGDLYLRHPEAWLESQVRAEIETIDSSLLPVPIYGQVPAFAAGDRGVIDLLAVDRTGRLAVIELKASADLHLPLQALDYWMRVNLHLARETFGECGYFPGIALRKDPPRLILVAPALEFHSSTESILRYLSPAIEVERIGLGIHWRRGLEVMFRLQGAGRPV